MTRTTLRRWLEAERDGELRGWRLRWLRRALERSPELRAERAALQALGQAIRDEERAVARAGLGGDGDRASLWSRLEGDLDRIDAERGASERTEAPRRGDREAMAWGSGLRGWMPAGALAGAAAAVLILFLAPRGAEEPVEPISVSSGQLRTLDTGGRPVWVQESEGATIIWLVGNGAETDDV